MEVRFREFRKGDMDALYFLHERCYPRGLSYGHLLDTLLDRDVTALVAEEVSGDQARLIGALLVQGDPLNASLYILSLMVDGEWRRLGIARRLMGWAERFGEGCKCTTLLAPLKAGNAEGRAFVAALGFAEGERHAPFFENPDAGRLWNRSLKAGGGGVAAAKAAEETTAETAGAKTATEDASEPAREDTREDTGKDTGKDTGQRALETTQEAGSRDSGGKDPGGEDDGDGGESGREGPAGESGAETGDRERASNGGAMEGKTDEPAS